jgi:hypothetical protein
MTKKEGHNVRDYVLFKRMSFKSKVSQILPECMSLSGYYLNGEESL